MTNNNSKSTAASTTTTTGGKRDLKQMWFDLSDSFRKLRTSCGGENQFDLEDVSMRFGDITETTDRTLSGGGSKDEGNASFASSVSMNTLKNNSSSSGCCALSNNNSGHNRTKLKRKQNSKKFVQQRVRFEYATSSSNDDDDDDNDPSNSNPAEEVITIDAIEDKFFHDVWYSPTELAVIQKENLFVLWKLMNGRLEIQEDSDEDEDGKNCLRGLEGEDPTRENGNDTVEVHAFVAVMKEQARQRKKGINNPQRIASVYRKNGAKQCQQQAHAMGLRDYKCAMRT